MKTKICASNNKQKWNKKSEKKRENPSDFESYSKHFITQHVTRRTLMLILLFHFSSIFVLLAFFSDKLSRGKKFFNENSARIFGEQPTHAEQIFVSWCVIFGEILRREIWRKLSGEFSGRAVARWGLIFYEISNKFRSASKILKFAGMLQWTTNLAQIPQRQLWA